MDRFVCCLCVCVCVCVQLYDAEEEVEEEVVWDVCSCSIGSSSCCCVGFFKGSSRNNNVVLCSDCSHERVRTLLKIDPFSSYLCLYRPRFLCCLPRGFCVGDPPA
uniref:(northern house mosquito) hypothetical protein n=1 Tax=Culex pipiens TaxID=7175 RepID=A0A8D8K181_CULPI